MTSALFPAIADEIAACGPLTLARFMEIALHDPANGYYARHPGLARPGADGDFVTAPEISQMFGELIGAWAIEAWRGMGAPDRFRLVEPGPGRGTMMADLWRVARLVPDFRMAAQIRLVERSHPLRAVQAQALADAPVAWCETIDAALGPGESEPLPFILLANEFLDCLPIRQWRRLGAQLEERRVALADRKLVFQWVPAWTEPGIPNEFSHPRALYPDGEIIETRTADHHVLGLLAHAMQRAPGIALFIDYGKARPGPGDTLQALRGHRKADPLNDPGEADLTAWVDFSALERYGKSLGLAVFGPVPQGIFLNRLGIETRAARLANASPAQAPVIARALARLIHASQMGGLFKVIALASPGLFGPDHPPTGFAP